MSVLLNYISLWRSGLFDSKWYRTEYPDVAGRRVDPMLHYLLCGGYEGRKPNPVFDSRWYLERYPDVASSDVNPLLHYVLHGAAEGRDPSESFLVREYLAQNPDVVASGLFALQHYLRFGRKEGRRVGFRDELRSWKRAPKPRAPDPDVWRSMAERGRQRSDGADVDVVIPVYAGFDDTLACIYSVLQSRNTTAFELIVIDDASPEPDLSAALADIAALGLVTLLRNDENLGFVGTTNRGMKLHPDRDVVLLNSDTVVYGNWLDRLLVHGRQDRVATVTPLSTNATICSYPTINRNNFEELEIGFSELDRLCAEVNQGQSVDVPTGVGFCMYLRREMLDEVGYFDEESFRRGYGEENDLCRRAAGTGWRNLMAADIFVRHTGEVSFAETAKDAQRKGMKALIRKHPDYQATVTSFVDRDPAAPLRRRIDARRVAAQAARNVLFVSHTWGGGIDRHMRDLAREFAPSQTGVLFMRPRVKNGLWASVASPGGAHTPNLAHLHLARQVDEVAALLTLAGVTHIHVHSLAGWDPRMLKLLPQLANKMNVPLDFTFHDYLAVCPRVNLVDGSGVFCGGPETRKCRTCLKRNGSEFGQVDVEEWQRDYAAFLSHARLLIAPSRDTAERIGPHIGNLPVVVKPHPEPRHAGHCSAIPWNDGDVLRVAVIGALGRHKGSEILLSAAKDAARRKLALEFVVIGYTDRDVDFDKLPNVRVTGIYSGDGLTGILDRERCHIAMIPSVWPETYSYTLSEALSAGFRIALFPFGAPYERLRAIAPDRAIALPLDALRDPAVLNTTLLDSTRQRELPVPSNLGAHHWTYESYYRMS